MDIGRRIYYDRTTGNIILDTGERSGDVVETTVEQDFAAYKSLAERVPETVGMLQLEYGQYAQDFATCSGYRVDVSGDEPKLVFSYPDPNEPEAEPAYQKPLSEQVSQLESDKLTLMESMAELYEMVLALQNPGAEQA
ncbi:MAG: hypothetical protein C6P35_03300 [Cohnella sp.]|uniref:hypothetical protein n=1 Tax=Cohnella sp. TaxID=1883426 RepID=UPI000E36A22F|nr:hypothetical protein [Cohnella sp.]REK68009.1 MAG: hypothetical protein C6P35_03300 [Cohnella sp.]